MSERLAKLIEAARSHIMTDDEREAQRISWAWGNLAVENPNITKADVVLAAAELVFPAPPDLACDPSEGEAEPCA